jgi:hypothetical protein
MTFTHPDGAFEAAPCRLVIAGWPGRDTAAVAHHIRELQDIGVAPPSRTPLFYRVSQTLLVQAPQVEVLGPDTSGEAEPLLLNHGGSLWLGLASDHTDRAMEAASVAASKQACPKVCAAELWPYDEVQDHIDDLRLRSWVREAGGWQPYQDGTLAKILPLPRLLELCPLEDGDAMLCGTLPALGAIRPAEAFRAELEDPVLRRAITLEYETTPLPVVK